MGNYECKSCTNKECSRGYFNTGYSYNCELQSWGNNPELCKEYVSTKQREKEYREWQVENYQNGVEI